MSGPSAGRGEYLRPTHSGMGRLLGTQDVTCTHTQEGYLSWYPLPVLVPTQHQLHESFSPKHPFGILRPTQSSLDVATVMAIIFHTHGPPTQWSCHQNRA